MSCIGSSLILIGGFNGSYLSDIHTLNLFQIKKPITHEIMIEKDYKTNEMQKNQDFMNFNNAKIINDDNDITLLCEGMRINFNKELLSEKSEYFRALFSNNFIERKLNLIEIKNFPLKIINYLMEFIYFNRVINDKMSENEEIYLLKASRFFIIEDLINIMQEKLVFRIRNHENFQNFEKIQNFYELSSHWNLNYLLKHLLLLISCNKKLEYIEMIKTVSPENFDINIKKIKKHQKELNFWMNSKNL